MSDQPLKHVIRPVPSWSTCDPQTLCSNSVFAGDLTVSQMQEYVAQHCRGSVHVAYGTCCVTCLQSMRNAEYSGIRTGFGEDVAVVADYLARRGRRGSHAARAERMAAEVRALDLITERYREEFRQMVEDDLERGRWRERRVNAKRTENGNG